MPGTFEYVPLACLSGQERCAEGREQIAPAPKREPFGKIGVNRGQNWESVTRLDGNP